MARYVALTEGVRTIEAETEDEAALQLEKETGFDVIHICRVGE